MDAVISACSSSELVHLPYEFVKQSINFLVIVDPTTPLQTMNAACIICVAHICYCCNSIVTAERLCCIAAIHWLVFLWSEHLSGRKAHGTHSMLLR